MRRVWVAVVAASLMGAVVTTSAEADDSAPGVEGVSTGPTTENRSTAEPAPQLRRKGRWLVDPDGRVVIVHGLNLVYKRRPYVPPNSVTGFRAADARWLARHGFNGARIGTLWAGLTPEAPGRADPTYLDRWQRVMDLLAEEGIWMQLDAHQDQWHETYGGEGAPDWAMIRPAPYSLLPPVDAPFPLGYWTPETSTVFDEFWANKHGLLDGWVAAWRIAAQRWKGQPYLMGYDLINEPWMGVEWAGCLTGGCQSSYRQELQPALEKALRAIRRIDRKNIVWWEPQQFSGGQKLDTYFTAVPGERQLGLSWHSYCPAVFFESQGLPGGDVESCWDFSDDRERHALDQAARMHAVPLMTEWGATDNLRAVHIDAEVADRHLMGWTHWAYKFWNDPTTADTDQGLFRDDRDLATAKTGKLRELVRTYAQATAGTPLTMRFDTTDGDFAFRFRPDPEITAPTTIFVSPLHYPRGYDVKVDHGRIATRTRRLLEVEASSSRVVQVRVIPRER
jgi:endoglycosylceramidase